MARKRRQRESSKWKGGKIASVCVGKFERFHIKLLSVPLIRVSPGKRMSFIVIYSGSFFFISNTFFTLSSNFSSLLPNHLFPFSLTFKLSIKQRSSSPRRRWVMEYSRAFNTFTESNCHFNLIMQYK